MTTAATRVAKKGTSDANGGVYIGRGSPFGNPFHIGKDGTREEVIQKYRQHFADLLAADPDFWDEVMALRGKTLVCFCAPLPCHGDVIVQFIEENYVDV